VLDDVTKRDLGGLGEADEVDRLIAVRLDGLRRACDDELPEEAVRWSALSSLSPAPPPPLRPLRRPPPPRPPPGGRFLLPPRPCAGCGGELGAWDAVSSLHGGLTCRSQHLRRRICKPTPASAS